jgi:hypothetical protein
VRVTTPTGAALTGDTVHWQVVSGGGSLAAPFSVTGADGNSSVVWTLGPSAGIQEVKAFVAYKTSNGLSTTLAHFSALATEPPEPARSKVSILHYDGKAWNVEYQTAAGDIPINLNSIWGTSPPFVFAVGSQSASPLLPGGSWVVLQFDGTSWPAPPPAVDLWSGPATSVSGSGPSDFFAIFNDDYGPMTIGSYVYRYDGQVWNWLYFHGGTYGGIDPYLNAIWSGSSNAAVAVGDSGLVVRYDGTAWNVEVSGTTQHLRAVWGLTGAASPIFAVGEGGTIIVFDGTAWHPQPSGTSAALYAVWGTSASDVFAAGEGGTIIHYDGTSWSLQNSTGGTLHGLWGSSGTSVFAVGDGPTIRHYDGSTWTAQTTTAAIDLRGVWGLSPTDVFAVGHPK